MVQFFKMSWKSTAAIYCTSVLLLTVFLVLSSISTEQDFPYGFQLTLLITSVMLPPAYHTCQILQAVLNLHPIPEPGSPTTSLPPPPPPLPLPLPSSMHLHHHPGSLVGSSDDELESVRSAGTQISSCPSSSRDGSGPSGGVARRMFKCHFCKQLVDSEEWYSGRHSQLCPMCPSYTLPGSTASGLPPPTTFSDILCPHCQQELSLHGRKGTFHCATCCRAYKNATLACRYKCGKCAYSLCLSCIQRWHWYNWMQSAREEELLLGGTSESGAAPKRGQDAAGRRSPPPSYDQSMMLMAMPVMETAAPGDEAERVALSSQLF